VAVGFGAIDGLSAKVLRGARPVLDHHRLAELRRQMLGQDARHQIAVGAGRQRHDDADRTGGIGLRGGERRARKQHQRERANGASQFRHRQPVLPHFCGKSITTRPAQTGARLCCGARLSDSVIGRWNRRVPPGLSAQRWRRATMSIGTIILIILVIALLGGFSGIGGGPFYGTGYYGGGGLGLVVVILLILVLMGRI
jgi:hypothetical protein